jgi:hypothetical protein
MTATDAPVQAGALLELVDEQRRKGTLARALAIAEMAGADADRLRSEPVGRLTDAVLAFRRRLVGVEMQATVVCEACRAMVEFTIRLDELRGLVPHGPTSGRFSYGDADATCEVSWRVPTVDDVMAEAPLTDPAAALRERCISARMEGRPIDVAAVAGLVERAETVMAAADPLAEVLVALECPDCGQAFDADLDPVGFVWAEVESRARRVLLEVDELARAYGWTEPQVLALSETRRSAYLALVRGGGR